MVPGALRRCIADFERDLSSSGRLVLLLDPGPGLPILEASATYVEATMTRRADLIGRNLFDVFPDNPADPGADGVANLYASLRIAAVSGKPHRMPVQRYDVRDSNGAFVERYWQPVNTPLMDSEGHVVALLHEVTDVTATCRPGA
ncbi:MAG: PAS domain-containing protein [Proteobacteria bacterium]|nr:PAS domain-containing protein [Pseudomonadota bacterium]